MAIRIIKPGQQTTNKPQEFKELCITCECEFVYMAHDTHTLINKTSRTKTSIIKCPRCNSLITLSTTPLGDAE